MATTRLTLPKPPKALKKLNPSMVRDKGTSEQQDVLRQTTTALREELKASLGAEQMNELLAEMIAAPRVAKQLAEESRALIELVAAAKRWRDARKIAAPSGHIAYMRDADVTLDALDAHTAIDREVEARQRMSHYEQLSEGRLAVHERATPAPTTLIAVRTRDWALRPYHLVLAEAVLVAERRIEPTADTWWRNPRRARRRWTEAVNAALRARRGARRKKPVHLSPMARSSSAAARSDQGPGARPPRRPPS
jgi:hypothetical protein